VSVHSCSTTRRQSSKRFFSVSAALPCNLIRCPPRD
jgi:hypothetical protein